MNFTGQQAVAIMGLDPEPDPELIRVLGIDPPERQTPLTLWKRLCEELDMVHERVVWGTEIDRGRRDAAVTHVLHGEMRAVLCRDRIDALRYDGDDRLAGPDGSLLTLAIKAPLHTAAAWDAEGPPAWVVVRVQHDLAVAELERCEGGILLAGDAWRRFSMRADPARQAVIAQALAKFEEAVRTRQPPAVTGPADLAVLKKLFTPGAAVGEVDLGEAGTAAWRRVVELRGHITRAKRERDLAEAQLRQALGSAAFGRLAGGRRLAMRSVTAPGGHLGSRLVELH